MNAFDVAAAELHPEAPIIARTLGVSLPGALVALSYVQAAQRRLPDATPTQIEGATNLTPAAVRAVLAAQQEALK